MSKMYDSKTLRMSITYSNVHKKRGNKKLMIMSYKRKKIRKEETK